MTRAPLDYADVFAWQVATFGEVARDPRERLMRFVEEAIELAHAGGLSLEDVGKIGVRVYGRELGDVPKEVAQAGTTLGTFALSVGIDLRAAERVEWRRIRSVPREEWARRHAAKVAAGIAS